MIHVKQHQNRFTFNILERYIAGIRKTVLGIAVHANRRNRFQNRLLQFVAHRPDSGMLIINMKTRKLRRLAEPDHGSNVLRSGAASALLMPADDERTEAHARFT